MQLNYLNFSVCITCGRIRRNVLTCWISSAIFSIIVVKAYGLLWIKIIGNWKHQMILHWLLFRLPHSIQLTMAKVYSQIVFLITAGCVVCLHGSVHTRNDRLSFRDDACSLCMLSTRLCRMKKKNKCNNFCCFLLFVCRAIQFGHKTHIFKSIRLQGEMTSIYRKFTRYSTKQ